MRKIIHTDDNEEIFVSISTNHDDRTSYNERYRHGNVPNFMNPTYTPYRPRFDNNRYKANDVYEPPYNPNYKPGFKSHYNPNYKPGFKPHYNPNFGKHMPNRSLDFKNDTPPFSNHHSQTNKNYKPPYKKALDPKYREVNIKSDQDLRLSLLNKNTQPGTTNVL